jgi:hypothetical protein
MKFYIEAECQKCGPLTPCSIRLTTNAGLYRLCQIVCTECGAHQNVWFTEGEYQTLFLLRMKEVTSEDSTPQTSS